MTRPMFPYAERLKEEMRALIEDPARWPHSILPVKRRTEDGEDIELGILKFYIDQERAVKTRPTVYPNALFPEVRNSLPEEIAYPDWDAFFADGWVVD